MRRLPLFPLFPYTTLFRSDPLHAHPPRALDEHDVSWGQPLQQVGHRVLERRGVMRVAEARRARRFHCQPRMADRKSTRLNSSHTVTSYAVFCLKKKIKT